MEPIRFLEDLQGHEDDTLLFKKLISFASSRPSTLKDGTVAEWKPILTYTVKIINSTASVGRERTLLASHAFFALMSSRSMSSLLESSLDKFLRLKDSSLNFLDTEYNIQDPESFKLTCAHGYLQANRREVYTDAAFLLVFDAIQKNCMEYTKNSYFAYKVLQTWMQRSMSTNFWSTCGPEIERKLEAIIFSNWSNAISEISKLNSGTTYNMYLRIMMRKYDGFLEYTFKNCVNKISWQNDVKYVILTEICELWDNVEAVTSHDFLLSLSTSLTKNYLRCGGAKVYLAILKKLNEDRWKESFGTVLNFLFHHWETKERTNNEALQLLCKHWLEPAIKRYKNIVLYLWDLAKDLPGYFLRSHLQRIASEMRVQLADGIELDRYVNHKEEIIRLNGFAINSYQAYNSTNIRERCLLTRHFLWYNANSTSVYMREGTIKYFKTFYANILKSCEVKANAEEVYSVTNWLHEFLLDCFEIGSCYQRKIFGLNLYRALLSFTNGNVFNKCNVAENAHCTLLLERHLKNTDCWKFTSKECLFALLRLVLDSALDVKQVATSIILDHFDKDSLTSPEIQILYSIAQEYCNSSKFYKAESGAALVTILTKWLPLSSLEDNICFITNETKSIKDYANYSEILLDEAAIQLSEIKGDTLKAIVRNKPFYGVLITLLKVAFQGGPESSVLTLEFAQRILDLSKEATDFFLAVLSSKSESTEYSSSFAEMGLAIDHVIKSSDVDDVEYDELNLTPAHQLLISCIWTSLKVLCELACEIGASMLSDETVRLSADIIVTVLFRCRHKGVVESAGTAIGNLTRALCKDEKYSDLSKAYITNILRNDSLQSLNITRRGAGLSIMFHRIVVSDNRRDRPTLRFAVQTLLDMLDNFSESSMNSTDTQHDSPWARHLHFLRALVADKEVHAHLTPYMEKISLVCFRYLESEVWTIRNAGLQLFGAIVPRLAGQSYGDGTVDFGNGYSINHFLTHYPTVSRYVLNELENFCSSFTSFSTELYLHSSIVHVLILLSKFSNSGCDLIEHSSKEFTRRTRHLLRVLFSDPVWYVRSLAAKAYAALTPLNDIALEIVNLRSDIPLRGNANLAHGHLLAIKFLKEKLSFESENVNRNAKVAECTKDCKVCALSKSQDLRTFDDRIENKKVGKPRYVIETLLLQLEEPVFDKIFTLDKDSKVFYSENVNPGFSQYMEFFGELYAEYVNRTNEINMETVHQIFNSECSDQGVAFLNRLSYHAPIFEIVLERILLNRDNTNKLLLIAMINFVMRTLKHFLSLSSDECRIKMLVKGLTVELEDSKVHFKLWLLKTALIVLFSDEEPFINKLSSHMLRMSVNEEEHVRKTVLQLLQFTVYKYKKLSSTCRLNVIHCCLILLKDEISVIREAIAESLRTHVLPNFTSLPDAQHDEVLYREILVRVISDKLESFSIPGESNLHFIELFTQNIKNLDSSLLIENPFYHEDSPIYKEESKFLNVCFSYMPLIKSFDCTNGIVDTEREIVATRLLQKKLNFDRTNLEIVLKTKYADYQLRKQGIVLEEYTANNICMRL